MAVSVAVAEDEEIVNTCTRSWQKCRADPGSMNCRVMYDYKIKF